MEPQMRRQPANRAAPEQAICMAFKRSFDGRGWVLRCFESLDEDTTLRVQLSEALGLGDARITEANMLERAGKPLEGNMTALRGFEIKTLRFE